jgi:hypothetical protein
MDPHSQHDADQSKRLSSIKSILNPTATSPGRDDYPEQPQQYFMTPGSTAASTPSPGAYSNGGHTSGPPQLPSPRSTSRAEERSKAERRAMLERERAMMRELLAAKERELAELGE